MTKKKIPSVFVCMPTYDTMQVSTCLSLIKLMDTFTKAGIKSTISTFKCPYVGYGRNVLTAMFLESGMDYQLFVDSDVEFDPKVVGRMTLIHKKVYEKLIYDHPQLKIKQKEIISEEANKLFYNFWDTVFDQQSGHWWGEDTHFSNIAAAAGFKFYAVVDGETTHHGSFGYTGSLMDIFKRPDEKAN